jgi:hypothetical protein
MLFRSDNPKDHNVYATVEDVNKWLAKHGIEFDIMADWDGIGCLTDDVYLVQWDFFEFITAKYRVALFESFSSLAIEKNRISVAIFTPKEKTLIINGLEELNNDYHNPEIDTLKEKVRNL